MRTGVFFILFYRYSASYCINKKYFHKFATENQLNVLTMKAIVRNGMWKAIALLTVVILFVSCRKDAPTVNTVSVSVSSSTITATGSVTSDGGADILFYGVCLSTNSLPTISDTKKEYSSTSGNSAKSFTASFTNLGVNLPYYVRAYAINSEGIGYGEAISIKISSKSNIKDVGVSQTATEATLSMTVNPNRTTTENWFEYGKTGDAASKILAASSYGSNDTIVSVKVTNLTPGTKYWFIAKSKNEYGETDSQTIIFYTMVSDYDGNLYHGVTIGSQIWLQENFRGTHFANGDPIPNVTDATVWANLSTEAYCWYSNDSELGKVYGGLYNWYVGADPRGLIAGYHVPTVYEQCALGGYLMSKYSDIGSYIAAGLSAMEDGHTHWNTTSEIPTNSSGFTALPNGAIALDAATSKFIFMSLREVATFWASTDTGSFGDATIIESANCGFTGAILYDKKYGFGLRLLKD